MARKLRLEYPEVVYQTRQELKRRKWAEADLERRPKGDRHKVDVAVRLRLETVMTVKWIAERLQMGAPGYLNHLLLQRRKKLRKKWSI